MALGLRLTLILILPNLAHAEKLFDLQTDCFHAAQKLFHDDAFQHDESTRHLGRIGGTWASLFSRIQFNKNSVIVEVGPGRDPKVGLGLSGRNFEGTYYIVDPEPQNLSLIAFLYRRLFPKATIIGIQGTLRQAFTSLPENIDCLVANHPLDDMLITAYEGPQRALKFFANTYWNNIDATRHFWNEMKSDAAGMKMARDSVFNEWMEIIREKHPDFVFISQYPSHFFAVNNISLPHEQADIILNRLKNSLGGNSPYFESAFNGSSVGRPEEWLLWSRGHEAFKREIATSPEALERLGESVFVEAEAPRLNPNDIEVLYVDPDVANQAGLGSLLSVPELFQKLISQHMVIDTMSENPNAPKATYWVDRQTDPSNIAMNGNQGSGRAGYVGRNFNLIGIGRTPFASAPLDDDHGNGYLSDYFALWRLISANTIHRNSTVGVSPKLALIRFKDKTQYPSTGQKFNRAILVRLDQGALDRPTHLHTGRSEQDADLFELARSFGRQEGEKFIERWEHGAPSAGNISLKGNILDMETVASVDGRHPQFSLTGYWPGNLFGMEHIAQWDVLEGLAKSAHVGQGRFDLPALKQTFEAARFEQIQTGFLELMGLDPSVHDKVLKERKTEIIKLASLFTSLSSKIFPDFHSLYTGLDPSRQPNVFDFSRFIRKYALVRHYNEDPQVRLREGMTLLQKAKPNFRLKHSRYVGKRVEKALLREHVLLTPEQYADAIRSAEEFIRTYEKLLDVLEAGTIQNRSVLASRAYRVNETRYYHTDYYGRDFSDNLIWEYGHKKLNRDEFESLVSDVLKANDRMPASNESGYTTDMRVYREGTLYREMDPLNLRHRIHLDFSKRRPQGVDSFWRSKWTLKVGKNTYPLRVIKKGQGYELVSRWIDNRVLLLGSQKVGVFKDGKAIPLTDLTDGEPEDFFSLKTD